LASTCKAKFKNKAKFQDQRAQLLWGAINMPNKQVKKTSKGESFGSDQVSINTNFLNTQIRARTCPMDYYPLLHKSTKEATSNKKRSLYGQITLHGQDHENKSLIKG